MAYREQYSSGSKFLHWLIALIVIIMPCLSFFIGDLPEKYVGIAFTLHKSFGICVLVLMLIRIIWISYTGKPSLPATVAVWERLFSRFVQYSLYIFVILMPLSGWIMSTASKYDFNFFTLFQLPMPGIERDQHIAELMQQVHNKIAWIIIVLLTLHIAGAFKHYFIDKDEVMGRMLPEK